MVVRSKARTRPTADAQMSTRGDHVLYLGQTLHAHYSLRIDYSVHSLLPNAISSEKTRKAARGTARIPSWMGA